MLLPPMIQTALCTRAIVLSSWLCTLAPQARQCYYASATMPAELAIHHEVAAMAELDPIDLERLLGESFLAAAEHHPKLDSTQDRAAAAAAAGSRGPLLIVADRQTAGRGRGSNRWWTGAGSLAFSLLFDPAVWGLSSPAVPLRRWPRGWRWPPR